MVARLWLVSFVFIFWAAVSQAACAPGQVDLRGPWGQAQFTVEIADTDETRARGLMHRERMARSAGMLFIYDAPTAPSFWMRNTLIPLDMLFIDPEGRITRIHHEAQPLDETPIPGGPNVLMVLEINGGLSRQFGITEGSEIRHPRLDQDIAAWPCD
ncbi:MAG: DUF192 domain-containing protein [Rhodobacteraceae bacterium]|nr:DUF192 domain-containing protein [Paracoccaceae bacterium]TVR46855.1 MAG: DUF192 domain-containing protein [Paracoccaceae bacterium]